MRLFLLVAFLVGGGLVCADECLVRGDFEFDGLSGVMGWNKLACVDGFGALETLVSEKGPGGRPVVRISGKTRRSTFYSRPVKLVVGEPYRFSAFVRTKGFVAGSSRMLITDTHWAVSVGADVPADTEGRWVKIEKTATLPAMKDPVCHLAFETVGFPAEASLDVCDPQLEPLSETAKKGSAPMGAETPLVGRIVPVEPLLDDVDAATGLIRFSCNLNTNGCDLVATVNGQPPGPLAEGRHEVNVKLVERETGKIRCENTYPFVARKRDPVRSVGRKLNNFVTEVLDVEAKDGEYAFENPRRGLVFIGFDRPTETARAYLGAAVEPVVVYRRDEPSETIRTLEPGTYRVRVEGADGNRLRVHLLKPLIVHGDAMCEVRSDFREGRFGYGWDFYRKCLLPSCGWVELAVHNKNIWPEVRRNRVYGELLRRGKLLLSRTGIGPTEHAKLANRKLVRNCLLDWQPYRAGYPLVWDEFGLHASARDLNLAGEEMWALANERRPNGVSADFFGLSGKVIRDYAPVVALISGIVNSGCGTGYLVSESYLRSHPNVADTDKEVDNLLESQRSLGRMMPEAGKRIIHILNGFEGIGYWTSHVVPEVDEKVLLDRWIHRMATDPDFADVGGLSTTANWCGEELLRWEGLLMHHYAVLGRTDSLTEARGWRYNPETVRDGDFAEGFAHWSVAPAEPGSITNMVQKGFGKNLQGRICRNPYTGDHFALLTRSAKGPNLLSQRIGNLRIGEWYALEFATADYANVLKPRTNKDDRPGLWAEVKGMPFDERYTYHLLFPLGANDWSLKKGCPFRTSRYVFKATAEEAEVVISDWAGATEPGGPIGRQATLNYISVNPFFAPAGNELEVSDDYDVRAYGARGDGKTLDTKALQAALDACAKTGGTVKVPKGTYLTGTLRLGNDTELRLEAGAVLLGSPNLGDYGPDDVYPGSHGCPEEGWSAKHLIVACGARNISITGEGAIDGNARAFMGELNDRKSLFGWRNGIRFGKGGRKACNRPGQQLVFAGCTDVRIEGVTLRNMNCWTCFIHGCADVQVKDVKVRNDRQYANTDAFDIDSSRNVVVSGCDIVTGDDAIAIRCDRKNLPPGAPSRVCENIVVSNCACEVSASGVRLGVGDGAIRNVRISNLDIRSSGTGILAQNCYGSAPQDGVDISDIRFSDVRIRDTSTAISLTANGLASKAKLSNVVFDRIDAESFGQIEVAGGGETRPDGIVFRNVRFRLTALPEGLSYPRPQPTVVERAGKVSFVDCDFGGVEDADPAEAIAREMARRAASDGSNLISGFAPVTIVATEEQARREQAQTRDFPVKLKAGGKYRVSYFVRGENICPLRLGSGASSVAWIDEDSNKYAGQVGYRMSGTFGPYLQAFEFQMPDILPTGARPKITLRLVRSSGKAVFDGLWVEELAERAVQYIAHQGEEWLAPGHSAAAYRMAVEHGLDYIKMDLRETKDGEIVLHHDATLKHLLGCPWKIREHTLAEIRASCRYVTRAGRSQHYNDYTNATVQTLQEGLQWGRRAKRGVWLDFKDFNPEMAERVVAMLDEAGILHERVMIATWSQQALAYMKDHHPEIRRVVHTYVRPKEFGYLTNLAKGRTFANEDQLLEALLEARDRLGLYGLNMPSGSVIEDGKVYYDTPPGFVRKLQKMGLWVSMWFVNDEKLGAKWREEGADAFVTNCKANTGLMPDCGVCAHQGDSSVFPGNTAAAIGSAVRKGVEMVEFDVRRCKGGEFVLLHDAALDRQTTGRGRADDLTLGELRELKLKWRGKKTDFGISTLDEALEMIPRWGVWINLHCYCSKRALCVLAKLMEKEGRLHQTCFCTHFADLSDVRKAVPGLIVNNIDRPGPRDRDWTDAECQKFIDDSIARKCRFLQLCRPWARRFSDACHDAGIKVIYYKADDPREIPALRASGVDFIMTDR